MCESLWDQPWTKCWVTDRRKTGMRIREHVKDAPSSDMEASGVV